jgi:hypothetical protein
MLQPSPTVSPTSAPTASPAVSPTASPALDRYLRHRRHWETALWIAFWVAEAGANSVTVVLEVLRSPAPQFAIWQPITWEFSSCLMQLALVPAVLAWDQRCPLRWRTIRHAVPLHFIASLVYSLIHVGGMVAARKLVYAGMGDHYDFGNWPRELFYEYLKDVRAYWMVLGLIYLYRLLLLRLQGEASLLDAPDSGPPAEPVERPERFLVRKLGKEFLINATDIEWIEAAGNYANLHVRGRLYPLRSTMAALEPRLDPRRFLRVHRSYIVNLDLLAEIEPLDSGDARLRLRDGTEIPCSRNYRAVLRQQAQVPASA